MRTKVAFVFALAVVMIPSQFSQGQDPNRKGLEGLLKPGTRAMTINVKSANLTEVIPGSLVDVVQFVQKDKKKKEEKPFVENVRVLALDIQPVRPEDTPDRIPVTVTLELTPKQALAIAASIDKGEITLRLHPIAPADKKSGKAKDAKNGPAKEK